MMNCIDCHLVVVGSAGVCRNFAKKGAHCGSCALPLVPHVFFFRHTFFQMESTVRESDEPRIWNGRGVLRLAFLRCARVNRSQLCDELIDVGFRTMLLPALEVPESGCFCDNCLHVLFV